MTENGSLESDGLGKILLGKKALIIGGGGTGIGHAITLAVARAGALVGIVDVQPARAEEMAAEVERGGGHAVALVGDIRRPDEIDRLLTEAWQRLADFDVLITVVGGQTLYAPFVRLHEYSDEQWDLILELNLHYVFRVIRRIVPVWMEREIQGSIVCVGSLSGGATGSAMHAAYGAAKSGLSHLARTVAVEYGPFGIRMNVVVPGTIQTPAAGERSLAEVEALNGAVPLGRRGQTSEVAGPVVFLASSYASYISGQTLLIDGGVSANSPLPNVWGLKSANEIPPN